MQHFFETWKETTKCWLAKFIVSAVLATFFYHATLFIAFCFLVFLDLFTRWIAIAHDYLKRNNRDATLFCSVYAIPEAHRAGLISSYVMRQAFYSKMVMYITLVIGACICDYMLHTTGSGFTIGSMTIGYLALTEFLSIIENLDEAGVSALHVLNETIKEKLHF